MKKSSKGQENSSRPPRRDQRPGVAAKRTGGQPEGQGMRPQAMRPADTKRRDAATPQRGLQHPRPHGPESTTRLFPTTKDGLFLFGRHAVEAALQNPARECIRLIALKKALSPEISLLLKSERARVAVEFVDDDAVLRSAVPADSPHQGLVLEVRPLPGLDLFDLSPVSGTKNVILMLDQVTDPHNVGACLRSAAALGARALITQDRNSPGESGTLARAASGGLETLPWVRVANLAQTLESLKNMGYWHVGLDGQTETLLRDVALGDNIVIVMGSEGKGLRPLVQAHCDAIAKIPMTGRVESLNVSNAAAIALYELANK